MPVDKQQHTTLTSNPRTAESSTPQEVVQQAFHQHLRDQIRGAVQVVMEEIMLEELTQSSSSTMGRNYPPTGKDTATAAIAVIWQPPLVRSRT